MSRSRFLFLVPVGLLAGGIGCSGPAAPVGPTAAITMSPVCDVMPALAVTGGTSTAGDADIVYYLWDFHDGSWALGRDQEHRWGASPRGPTTPEPLAVEVTLNVTDANGLSDTKTELTNVTSCLSIGNSSASIDVTAVTPSVDIKNESTYRDALVAFDLDVVRPNGLPLALGLEGGQHAIARGEVVNVFSVAPIDCGTSCAEFTTAFVVPHVRTTYWCQVAADAGCL